MDDKERIVAIMRGGDFSNYPELADLLIADGLGYGKSYDYTAAFNAQDQERIKKLEVELTTYKQEYKLAAAANKGLAEALDKEREANQYLRLQLFAFIRNSTILPIGLKLGKTEQEITDKVFETIAGAEKILDKPRMIAAMNLATDKENRYDRE